MTDPRVERTRQALFSALDELLAEMPFGEISVSALAKRANVGRQTLYRHFDSMGAMVDARMQFGMAEQIELARSSQGDEADWMQQVALVACERVAAQPHISRAILSGEAGQDALASMRAQLVALRSDAPNDPLEHVPADLQGFVASFYAGAVAATLLHWIEAGCTPDAETMSGVIARLTANVPTEWGGITRSTS
ncbi:TetR/AcrR family transcriptional regulator [Salipiger sp. 1_MG-2023]|uniref:TetR/AcrR family transcriptional regulator n=1 Tax=Salipiger sp. 1_MG-2023 TaxID=3062665 RepID=UPI0026E22194|nr:TetR/AcrR family transcriptional regulator [Salipiger sp. 1_MG-2023]MDO6585717.1 TetR/AcrR family transcriptional regulator [Salipiger sp. 1_MG-2023]